MMDAAIQYAAMGWYIFPLKPDTKQPAIKAWNNKASNNANQIRFWWSKWPDANIGILMGNKSGLFAVDIDPKNGGDESIAHLLNDFRRQSCFICLPRASNKNQARLSG